MNETHIYRSLVSCVRCVIIITHFCKTYQTFGFATQLYGGIQCMNRGKLSNFPKYVNRITHPTQKSGLQLHTSASFIKRSKVCNCIYTVGVGIICRGQQYYSTHRLQRVVQYCTVLYLTGIFSPYTQLAYYHYRFLFTLRFNN